MSAVVTSQPEFGAACPSQVIPWITPGVPTRVDFLSLLPRVWVKHVLLSKEPSSLFLPSEYHVTTPDGRLIYLGKEQESRLQVDCEDFNISFFDSTDEEALTFRRGLGRISPCLCCGVQRQPACILNVQDNELGQINQRKQGCSAVQLVYQDEKGTESKYSIPLLDAGSFRSTLALPIYENGAQAGTIEGEIVERGKGDELTVHYKISFPDTADARQKAALIAAVVHQDTSVFSPLARRQRGKTVDNPGDASDTPRHTGTKNSVHPS